MTLYSKIHVWICHSSVDLLEMHWPLSQQFSYNGPVTKTMHTIHFKNSWTYSISLAALGPLYIVGSLLAHHIHLHICIYIYINIYHLLCSYIANTSRHFLTGTTFSFLLMIVAISFIVFRTAFYYPQWSGRNYEVYISARFQLDLSKQNLHNMWHWLAAP